MYRTTLNYLHHYRQAAAQGLTLKDYSIQNGLSLNTFYQAICRLRKSGYIERKRHISDTVAVSFSYSTLEIPYIPDDVRAIRDILVKMYSSRKSERDWCIENDIKMVDIQEYINILKSYGVTINRVYSADRDSNLIDIDGSELTMAQTYTSSELKWIDIITRSREQNRYSIKEWCERNNIQYNTYSTYFYRIKAKGWKFKKLKPGVRTSTHQTASVLDIYCSLK